MRIARRSVHGSPVATAREHLERVANPDVLLLQEAPETSGQGFDPDRWTWTAILENSRFGAEGKYRWATGTWVKDGKLQPVELADLGPGCVSATRDTSASENCLLVNIHVEIVDQSATKTLDAITETLHEIIAGEDRVIIGGDLNVDWLYGEVHRTPRHAASLDLLASLGLFHVNDLLPRGSRTFRNSTPPYNHFFISNSMSESVKDIRVITDREAESFSDHYSLVLDLDGSE